MRCLVTLLAAAGVIGCAPALRADGRSVPEITNAQELVRRAAEPGRTYRVAAGVYEIEPPLIVKARLVGVDIPTIRAASQGSLSITNTWSALIRVQGEGGLDGFTVECDGKVANGISVEALRSVIRNCRILDFTSKGIRAVHCGKPVESLEFEHLYIRSNRGVNQALLVALQVDPRSKPCRRLRVRHIVVPRDGLSPWKGKTAVAIKIAAVDDAVVEDLHTEYRWVFGENCGRMHFRDVSFGSDPEFFPDVKALEVLKTRSGMFPKQLIVQDVRRLKRFVDPNYAAPRRHGD